MFLLSLTRIIRFSLQNFFRNIWLSIVTITILVLTLFSLTSLIILNAAADQAITTVKDKIDISLYFNLETAREQTELIKGNIEKYDSVKNVSFISAEQNLEKFKQAHQGDQLIEEALKELDSNPLGPVLTISAKDVNFYSQILNQIKQDKIDQLVAEIDYNDHKLVIERLTDISQKIKTFGWAISGFFALIALLVVFNTIRIGIYTHRDEINIMRLVGADNWFIRAPFLLEGIIYAVLGSLIFWFIFYFLASFLQPLFYNFFIDIDFNLMSYIYHHLFYIFGFELILVMIINIISSFIAVGKYLRV